MNGKTTFFIHFPIHFFHSGMKMERNVELTERNMYAFVDNGCPRSEREQLRPVMDHPKFHSKFLFSKIAYQKLKRQYISFVVELNSSDIPLTLTARSEVSWSIISSCTFHITFPHLGFPIYRVIKFLLLLLNSPIVECIRDETYFDALL